MVLNDASMTYGEDNRLLTYNGQSVAYDADGNMTRGPLGLQGTMNDFQYDSKNRLTKAGTTEYSYDAENNRKSVTVNGQTTKYVVNPESTLSQVLIRTNPDGAKTYYIYGISLIGQENSNGSFQVYHFDRRGSTTAITDISGNVTDRFTYGPYGELTSRNGSTDTPFQYSGRDGVMTDSNGLYYMRARYYNPGIKRFINMDVVVGTAADGRTLNRFAYVNGNPVNSIDPFGLSADIDRPWYMDAIHTALDFVGFVPFIGDFADGINGAIYLAEGDYKNAALSFISMIPYIGSAIVMGGKYLYKGIKYAEEAIEVGTDIVKAIDKATDITKDIDHVTGVLKYSDEVLEVARYTDEAAGILKYSDEAAGIVKYGDEAAEALSDTSKTVEKGKILEGACFVAGTQIVTEDGNKPIEDIKVGDKVYSQNTETGEKGYKSVKNVFVKQTGTLVHVFVEDTEIETTENHPFWVVDKGWAKAEELKAGDKVQLASGKIVEVKKVVIEKLDKPIKVYNFEVEDWHTYFVSGIGVLVHNSCMMPTDMRKRILENIAESKAARQASDYKTFTNLEDYMFGATGGRFGSMSTRVQNVEVAMELRRRGYIVTNGAGFGKEEYLKSLTGYRKGGNFVDITAVRNGKTLRINTIDTYASGTATIRELRNAKSIRMKIAPGEHLVLIPKR